MSTNALEMSNGYTIIKRYSEDDTPDERGRWARKVLYKGLLIGWISRIEINSVVKFHGSCYFPSNSNDSPHINFVANDFNSCLEVIKNEFMIFLRKVL